MFLIDRISFYLLILLCFFYIEVIIGVEKIVITRSQAKEIGHKIWKNECNGSIEGLTSWNKTEEFPSLGIGHFIWFPKKIKEVRFNQAFPSLIWFMRSNGVKIPKWISIYAPWDNREQFLKEFNGSKLKELRKFLLDNVDMQAKFIIKRLVVALPIITKGLNKKEKREVISKFKMVARSANGLYALVDYINFKGYGVKDTEDYNGVKWGLLQVLKKMKFHNFKINDVKSHNLSDKEILKIFYEAAKKVLIKRILYASKDERHWWPGWKNRLKTYIE